MNAHQTYAENTPLSVPIDRATPSVSVITIFWNAARFLEEAVASVFRQSFTDWELLLVNDGSTDGSTDIARRLAAEHPDRIRYLEHPDGGNHGLSATRNLGLRHARGNYVAFLDADDVYLPNKLKDQVHLLGEHPTADMVYGATLHWFSWTGRPQDKGRDAPKRLGVSPDALIAPPTLVPRYLDGTAQTPGTSGFLVRRKAALRVGGFEDSFKAMSEDAVFFVKIALESDVFVASKTWDQYRQHSESLSNEKRRSREYRASGPNPSRRAFLEWLDGYLRSRGIEDAEVWEALEEQMRPYRDPLAYARAEIVYHVRRFRRAVTRYLGLA